VSAGHTGGGKPPGLHALIIGVGAYPWLRRGERYVEGAHPRADDFAQLSSPPHSAYALAHWLSTVQSAEAAAPLGSLELLVSAAPGFEHGYESLTVKARQATFGEIRDAFSRWRDRCNENEENIALFYFCGHGYAAGQQEHVLLPEDFGEDPDAFYDNGIDLVTTMQAVAEFQASTQIFLIDACREELDNSFRGRRGRGLGHPRNPGFDPAPDLAIFHSAQYGRRAFGRPGAATTFTQSLIQALDGLGAVLDDRWGIDLVSLSAAVAKLVPWNTLLGADGADALAREQKSSQYVSGLGRPLRLFDAAPQVPFRIRVQPTDAMASAELHLTPHDPDLPVVSRPKPSYEMWKGTATAGSYKMSAAFSEHEDWNKEVSSIFMPPCVDRTIDVTPSQDAQDAQTSQTSQNAQDTLDRSAS